MPPLGNAYNNLEITSVSLAFPTTGDFTLDLGGSDIQCGVYLTRAYDFSFLSYSGLL